MILFEEKHFFFTDDGFYSFADKVRRYGSGYLILTTWKFRELRWNSKTSKPEEWMARNKFKHTPSDVFPTGVFELEVSYTRKATARIKLTSSDEVAVFVGYLFQEFHWMCMLQKENQTVLFSWFNF